MKYKEAMNSLILDGREARRVLGEVLAGTIQGFSSKPHLTIILVGENPESAVYVRNKIVFGESLGVSVTVKHFPLSVSEDTLQMAIAEANADSSVHGIIVQAPLPEHLSFDRLTASIVKDKDVDGLAPGSHFVPATARGVLALLEFYDISLSGKHAVVIGRSRLAGLPIALSFLRANATVTICHSQTQHLEEHTATADIIVAALGKPEYISRAHINPGQVIVDVGIHRKGETLVGDVERTALDGVASAFSPVPGGVGPMTVLALFQNVAEAYQRQVGKKGVV